LTLFSRAGPAPDNYGRRVSGAFMSGALRKSVNLLSSLKGMNEDESDSLLEQP